MVSSMKDGFLHITEVGGIDPRVLPGQMVTVHATGGRQGKEDLPGLIVQPPRHLLPPGFRQRHCSDERPAGRHRAASS